MKQTTPQQQKQRTTLRHHSGRVASCLLLCTTLPGIVQADWPVAVTDAASTPSNQSLVIQVLANDIGEGLEITEVNTTTGRLGSASINADKKSVTYQSATDFKGTDTFWYAFKDNQGRTNAAKVTVDVSESGMPSAWPSSSNDSIETTTNTAIKIPVLSNDTGVDLVITQVNSTTVGLGQAEIVDQGQNILYTPASDYTGTDEFWYVFKDKWGRTNAGKVTPIVKPDYSGWPSATADYASTKSTATVTVKVLDNDSGESLKLNSVNDWTVGSGRARIEDNYIRYTPALGFSGQDSFWYDFEDAQGRKNSTQVFVNVTENTALSSIEFCGTTYKTDGTIENTSTTSQAADPDATEISISVNAVAFPVQEDSNFAVVGDRRYFLNETTDAKELWMEKNGSTTMIATHSGSEKLYGVGIKDGALFYSNTPTDNPSTSGSMNREVLYSHDGNQPKVIGEFHVYALSSKIRLTDNAETHFTFRGSATLDVGGNDALYYRINEISDVTSLAAKKSLGAYGGEYLNTTFNYNGLTYSTDSWSYRSPGGTTIKITDRYSSDVALTQIPGFMNKAVVSNARLLMTTRSHADVRSDPINYPNTLSTIYPAKLFATNRDNEFVELAVCDQ